MAKTKYKENYYPNWLVNKLCSNCKNSAKAKGLEYALSPSFLLELLERQNWRCPMTRVYYEFDRNRNPAQPSVDRIDNSKGYVPDNVQIVSLFYNNARNIWEHDELVEMAQALVEVNAERAG
jgi:hypothetical protein